MSREIRKIKRRMQRAAEGKMGYKRFGFRFCAKKDKKNK